RFRMAVRSAVDFDVTPAAAEALGLIVPDHDLVALFDDRAVAGFHDHAPSARLDPLLAPLLNLLEAHRLALPLRTTLERGRTASPCRSGGSRTFRQRGNALRGAFGARRSRKSWGR